MARSLQEIYNNYCQKPSDINEHLPTLLKLASNYDHVTEFGSRFGRSTSALLMGKPKKMISYDNSILSELSELKSLAPDTDYTFIKANVLEIEIEETDFLFIDTWHAYKQLKAELEIHSSKVRHKIALHDTEAFKFKGDTCKGTRDPEGGLWPAIEEFVAANPWKIERHFKTNNGLTILTRD